MTPKTKTLLGRVILFAIYLFLGGLVFKALEAEHQRRSIKYYQAFITNFSRAYNITPEDMAKLEMMVLTGERNEPALQWNYGNAVIFSGTTILTVGYGNFNPKTMYGKAFCMAFAVFGIPITCITLKSLGEHILILTGRLLVLLNKPRSVSKARNRLYLKTAILHFFLTVIVILLCGFIATFKRKDWTYFESVYFVFITITTIGFGDYVPQYDEEKTAFDILTIIVGFVVGFSVMSSFLCSISNAMEESGFGKVIDAAQVIVMRRMHSTTGNSAEMTASCQEKAMKISTDNVPDLSVFEKPGSLFRVKFAEDFMKQSNEKERGKARRTQKVQGRRHSDPDVFLANLSNQHSRQSSIVSLGVVKI